MISPEILRRYPFFVDMDDSSIKAIAMITEEVTIKAGESLYQSGQPNHALYLLEEGVVEASLVIKDSGDPKFEKEFYLDDLNPGEIFGLNALIEPNVHSITTRVSRSGKMLRIDGEKLNTLCVSDTRLGLQVMKQLAKTALERLAHTRVQLAAAR
ncbi:MAG: cyclic nucleotide-binding domain-containing protein [Anaerolineaceae bacterium]|nr:cyclic nucleotide-binding domain-containing protein [Anaerolineaceae bacterium]